MSQDISPNWMVLLEFTYRIIQNFFLHFPHVQDSIMIRFHMSFSYCFKFPKFPIFLSDVRIPRIRIFLCFTSFPQVHLHLSPTAT